MSGIIGGAGSESGVIGDFNRLCFYATFDDNGWSGIQKNSGAMLGTGDSQWIERDYGGLGADHYGLFDAASGVFTAKRKGWYHFDRVVRLNTGDDDEYFTSYFKINDTSNFGASDSDSRGSLKDGGATALYDGAAGIVTMDVGDYIWLVVHHWFGSSGNYEVPSNATWWSGHFIGGI